MDTLTPGQQARFHAGCICRHSVKACAAFARSSELRAWAIGFAMAVLLFCLVGCHQVPVSPAAAPTTGATADQARAAERAAIADRDSATVATVQAWMERIPQMTPEAWRSEFQLFLARYRDVQPRPEHVAAATSRVSAWAEGRTEEAQQQTAAAMVDAKLFVSELAQERAARMAAEQSESRSREAAQKRIAELEEQNRKLEDSIWQRVRFWFSLCLYTAAAGCLLLAFLRIKAAMATGLNVLAAAKTAATWTGFAAALFSLSRVLAAWWFWWACGGVLALVAAYVGFLVWREQRGEAASRALQPVVATLDQLYDDASGAAKEQMDADLFAKLSEAMKQVPGAKAFIHQIRAAMPAPTPAK
jgi:hypothetical protein